MGPTRSPTYYYLSCQNAFLIKISKNRLFLFLVLMAIGLRLTSFFPLVIDHDESTYLIIADQWLKGKIPYVDNIEVKPIGIFLLFASVLKIASSVWAVRLAAAVAIGMTGFFLALASNSYFKNSRGIFVGTLYVFAGSLHKWSWSANTEIFFLLFSSVTLYLLIRYRKPGSIFLAGLSLGLGFLFKYHILFDGMAFGLLFIILRHRQIKKILIDGCLFIVGMVLPMAICLASYFIIGHLDEFIFATWTIPSRYTSDTLLGSSLLFMGEFYLSLLPLSLLFWAGLATTYQKRHVRVLRFILIWLILSWFGILFTGKNYFHYYFQALPCLCFFLPQFIEILGIEKWAKSLNFQASQSKWIVIIALLFLTNFNQFLFWNSSSDYLPEAAAMIRNDESKVTYIYTNHQNILYYLTDTSVPTKYIHTSLLYKPDLAFAFGVKPDLEFRRIIEKKPRYYLFRGKIPSPFQNEISSHYELAATWDDETQLFRRPK